MKPTEGSSGVVTHRELDGGWGECTLPETCPLLFHFPGQSPAAMAALPEGPLLALLNVIEPPVSPILDVEARVWRDAAGAPHRDYDLPASIKDDTLIWYRHGLVHRDGERPSVVYPDGWREWWVDGTCVVTQPEPDAPYVVREGGDVYEVEAFPVGLLAILALDQAVVEAEGH